jgi:mRNA-degrading endonuclease RelE of RelBE toxin-antitoxin system
VTEPLVWEVEWTPAAERDLAPLDPPVARRIVQALVHLAATGQGDVTVLRKPLTGCRLRVGDWCVHFVYDRRTGAIYVLHVLHR